MKKLTLKQRAFANEYVKTKEGIAAYRASYNTKASNKVASNNARVLLANPLVQTRIALLLKPAESRAVLTAQQVLEQLTELACKKTLLPRDRLKALELMGKYRKLFTDKVELGGASGPLIVQWTEAVPSTQEQGQDKQAQDKAE